MARTPQTFSDRIVAWQREHGRHDLPWQQTVDPYRIWVSEVMLQQTQVATVIPYFQRFMARFPTVQALANASDDELIAHWAGLGYYARARNLLASARTIVERMDGVFPESAERIETLPGVGRSTAAAIASLAFGQRCAILDGNVKRVLARHFAVEGDPRSKPVQESLWTLAESLLPHTNMAIYTQGLMDLGATLCGKRPQCESCPVRRTCEAHRQGRELAFPGRGASKPRRETESVVVIVRSGKRVLLIKRPPTGIWGGLWSLPEFPRHSKWRLALRQRFGIEGVVQRRLAPIQHEFTHIRARFHPVDFLATRVSLPTWPQTQISWVDCAEWGEYGVPVAVTRILSDAGLLGQPDAA